MIIRSFTEELGNFILDSERTDNKAPMQSREKANNHLEKSAFFLLRRAGQFAADLYASEIGTPGLTPRQFMVLQAVENKEGLSQTELVERTGIDRSTLADVVQRLLKKNLLQRRRTKEDARANSIRLSAAGRRALQATQPGASMADRKLLEALPTKQRKEFMNSLRQISNALDEYEASSQSG